MRKTILTLFGSLALAAVFSASTANAAAYRFTFESFDDQLTAEGQFTVNASDEVTAVSGKISGLVDQTITGVAVNPSFPNAAYSPDGSFIYNNLYYNSGMRFDIDGLLFTTAQDPHGFWNLWGNFPGNYSLFESAGSYNYPVEKTGSLSVAAVPETSTWAMLALGFASLGLVGRRRGLRLAEAGLV